MRAWRVEIRIFGLLFFALAATLALYAGISAANVKGTILGMEIPLAGPIACFAALLLVFKLMGLFHLGLESDHPDPRPLDRLSAEEIESELDEILKVLRKTERRKQQLEAILAGLNAGVTPEEAFARGLMRPVGRPVGL